MGDFRGLGVPNRTVGSNPTLSDVTNACFEREVEWIVRCWSKSFGACLIVAAAALAPPRWSGSRRDDNRLYVKASRGALSSRAELTESMW